MVCVKNNVSIRLILSVITLFSFSVLLVFVHYSGYSIVSIAILLFALLVSYRDMRHGLYLFLFLYPFNDVLKLFGSNLSVYEPVLFCVLIIWCLRRFSEKNFKFEVTKFGLVICLFLCISILSLSLSYSSELVQPGFDGIRFGAPMFSLRQLLVLFEGLVIYLLFVNVFGQDDVRTAVRVIMLSALVSCLFAFVEYFMWGSLRVKSFFDHPNFFGMYLVMVLPLVIYVFFNSTMRWIVWVVPFCVLLSLVLTFSRGAIFGVFALVVFYLVFVKIRGALRFYLAVLTIFGIVLFSSAFFWPPYLEETITVNSTVWQRYDFTVPEGQSHLVKVEYLNPYVNKQTNEYRALYISNISPTISQSDVFHLSGETGECLGQCGFFGYSVLQTFVDDDFSLLLRAHYGLGWPNARIRIERDDFGGWVRGATYFQRFWLNLDTLNGRLGVWKHSVDLIFERPFFGYGYVFFDVPFSEGDMKTAEHSHNLFLQILLEKGFVGLFVFSVILYLFFRDVQAYRGYSFALACGVAAMLAHGLVDYSLKILLLFFTYLALVFVNWSCADSVDDTPVE